MLIKICGLTNPDTAAMAAKSGADYIGLLFSACSPRQISLDKAREISKAVRDAGSEVVAVFVDESLEELEQIAVALDLKIIQLHGGKVRAFCDVLAPKYQIIYVADGKSLPASLNPNKDFIMYDNKSSTYPEIDPKNVQTCGKSGDDRKFRYFVAGNLSTDNIQEVIKTTQPNGVDLSSSVEISKGIKDIKKIREFIKLTRPERYGRFGGRFVPELLIKPLQELETAFKEVVLTKPFQAEFIDILKNYTGRPTALTEVKNFAAALGDIRVFLKREDLLHTGAHKINNAVGQCLLAKKMGKIRIIAETGAGQHGLATATACAMFGLECVVYMGKIDVARQAPNVAKMRLLGAKVVSVASGSATLKDAVNEALRDWAESYETSHYCLGSALGPYPFPQMVAHFHAVIGKEAHEQFLAQAGSQPDMVVACVGGGSNAIGIFQGFMHDPKISLIGVEAGGKGTGLGNNAARFSEGFPGVLHGSYTYLLQTSGGQIVDTYSISAGLDYPAVGPEHSDLYLTDRAKYYSVTDKETLEAFQLLIKTEGIIPALESSHALAYVKKIASSLKPGTKVLINLSGRGDKDLPQLLEGELKHVTSI
ncbi:MAG: trpB [Burkholderiales bacterium]|jgi:phosphoribosylanthranilate isomerase|nr:trpB [Burkholderiales bacterium]